MAPRTQQPASSTESLSQPRERTIRNPRVSTKTTLSEVFLEACKKKDFQKINACLTLGVDINSKDSDNHSALYHSLGYGGDGEKIFDCIITQPELDVEQINKEGILMMVSCGIDQREKLRKLCQLPGIDVNAANPLSWAVGCYNVAAIKILAKNPNLNWNAGNCLFATPIIGALERGFPEVVEILLSQPTLDLERSDDEGRSVGHIAVECSPSWASASPVKCVELLSMDSRVNWNVRNKEGETPIMVALNQNKKEIVKILLITPRLIVGTSSKPRRAMRS